MEITIPVLELPPIKEIKTIEIPLPKADVPFYIPMVVPPSDLQAEEELEAETSEETPAVQPGMKKIDIPL